MVRTDLPVNGVIVKSPGELAAHGWLTRPRGHSDNELKLDSVQSPFPYRVAGSTIHSSPIYSILSIYFSACLQAVQFRSTVDHYPLCTPCLSIRRSKSYILRCLRAAGSCSSSSGGCCWRSPRRRSSRSKGEKAARRPRGAAS